MSSKSICIANTVNKYNLEAFYKNMSYKFNKNLNLILALLEKLDFNTKV